MTGTELIEFFEAIVEDSLDTDLALSLINNAKTKVEEERDWEFLKKLQPAQAASASAKTLPADYASTISMYVDRQQYHQIPFEQQKMFEQSNHRWYLDLANNSFYLLGNILTGTIYHYYKRFTDDITEGTSPVWPVRFHKLLAFEAAELFFAVDQGDRPRSWDDKWAVQKQQLRLAMIDWDVRLSKRAVENGLQPDQEMELDLGTLY